MDVDINTDTMRARRSKTTPVSERKLINRATTKTTSVKKIFASLSEQLNENNSVLVGADDSHLSIREADMEFSSPRGRAGSFNDSDSPWQNGQFKSPKEIVRYYREQFGDWWNVLPKTDFTYDESSKWYRKEIAPGIPVIPNLARPPLHPVEQISRFNLFSRSSGSSHETSSSNGKSQFSRFPILERDNRSFLSKVSDFIIDCLLGLLCLPYDLLFGNYWNSKSSSVTGRNSTSNKSVWWTAPFRWTYQLMMLLFSWEIMILVTVRGFFKNLGLRTAFKLFLFLSIVGSIVWAFGHFGVELSTIQIPSINISDFQNFTEWDYSGAIEMLKPLNLSWAYDQYENLVNIGWIYE